MSILQYCYTRVFSLEQTLSTERRFLLREAYKKGTAGKEINPLLTSDRVKMIFYIVSYLLRIRIKKGLFSL